MPWGIHDGSPKAFERATSKKVVPVVVQVAEKHGGWPEELAAPHAKDEEQLAKARVEALRSKQPWAKKPVEDKPAPKPRRPPAPELT